MSILGYMKYLILLINIVAACAWAADATTTTPADQPAAPTPAAPKNYISYELEFKPYEKMRKALEKNLKHPLKNRGEAHITIISPPEFDKITQKMDIEKVQALTEEFLKSMPEFKVVCVGSGSVKVKNRTEKTYYAVVESPALLEFRQKLEKLTGLSKDIFNADIYYPHITLGYTSTDLHVEDGVVKDQKTCLKK